MIFQYSTLPNSDSQNSFLFFYSQINIQRQNDRKLAQIYEYMNTQTPETAVQFHSPICGVVQKPRIFFPPSSVCSFVDSPLPVDLISGITPRTVVAGNRRRTKLTMGQRRSIPHTIQSRPSTTERRTDTLHKHVCANRVQELVCKQVDGRQFWTVVR